jgi:ferredoxin-thioredoxin reductase catalytic chain
MDERAKTLIKKYEEHSEANGIRLNPKEKIVEHIVESLFKNEEKFGKKYCPCRRVHDDASVCPCIYHKKEIEDQGHCLCFLFVSKDR